MKKSELYTLAMVGVVNSRDLATMDKLEIIETLLADRSIAEYRETQEEKKAQEEANNG